MQNCQWEIPETVSENQLISEFRLSQEMCLSPTLAAIPASQVSTPRDQKPKTERKVLWRGAGWRGEAVKAGRHLASKSITEAQATPTAGSAASVWVPEKTQEQTSFERILNASEIFVKLGWKNDSREGKVICLKLPSTGRWQPASAAGQAEQTLLIT